MIKKFISRLNKREEGAAAIEMAFALPIFIMLLWMVVQMGLVMRAVAGMQHALGEGARLATIYPTPTSNDITNKITDRVYGIGPGTFSISDPVWNNSQGYVDLEVTYNQKTDLLFLPGPDVSLSRNKRVYVAN
ncbi:TadE/TadG family type IV pilus assembly protein [Sphingomicrobium aestuariivivum]|uniref:TadE/TadG family type IV pilus assembly protein n=1 Tax=Sphingomicrobium aestuariivivum TaxID=1582356 RepID=UPI001FD6D680|nr:TadE/TadG family type IV pilus assembly protein [Sphingomicrobium aestuariivivum]MCJ8190267.1 pilus assembly protein [Sphingomicrobium aestuariivivum]